MKLKEIFHRVARKVGMGLCILAVAFMAGCGYPAHELGQDPAVPVTAVTEAMFDGAAAQQHVTVDGASLQTKNAYNYTGSVTIRGNVPANTDINVEGGRLEITGNVGDGSSLSVHMPVSTHSESYTYTTFMMVGKTMIPMVQYRDPQRGRRAGLPSGPARRREGRRRGRQQCHHKSQRRNRGRRLGHRTPRRNRLGPHAPAGPGPCTAEARELAPPICRPFVCMHLRLYLKHANC